jgi:adenine deaminase
MFAMPEKNRTRLIKAATGEIQCDLTIENVQVVDVFTGTVFAARVDVVDGVVAAVREKEASQPPKGKTVFDGQNAVLAPGFIDVHMHVESTMLTPENFGKAAIGWGTTTVVTDPHEIGNVSGLKGVEYMLDSGKKSPMRQYVLAPSCVPAAPAVESSGASFGAEEIAALLAHDGVIGIAEIMDYLGVCRDDARMHAVIGEGLRRGAFLQGHAPGVSGDALNAYLAAGPQSDHECFATEEVLEKARLGMHINARASSLVDNARIAAKAAKQMRWSDSISLCTDDVHASDLLETGHISHVAARLLEEGLDPVHIIRLGTYNAAREYGFSDIGAIAPGYVADFQLLPSLDALGKKPLAVFAAGKQVAKDGKLLGEPAKTAWYEPNNTVRLPQIQSPADFDLLAPEGCGDSANVLVINSILLEQMRQGRQMERVRLPVESGTVKIDDTERLQYICVANRYGTGDCTTAILANFGLTDGALATTISHDSHNLTVVYADAASAFAAAKELERVGGGICVAKDGKVCCTLKLPIGGLMSPLPAEELVREIDELEKALSDLRGGKQDDALLRASVLALPARPGVIITDRGVVLGDDLSWIPVFEA